MVNTTSSSAEIFRHFLTASGPSWLNPDHFDYLTKLNHTQGFSMDDWHYFCRYWKNRYILIKRVIEFASRVHALDPRLPWPNLFFRQPAASPFFELLLERIQKLTTYQQAILCVVSALPFLPEDFFLGCWGFPTDINPTDEDFNEKQEQWQAILDQGFLRFTPDKDFPQWTYLTTPKSLIAPLFLLSKTTEVKSLLYDLLRSIEQILRIPSPGTTPWNAWLAAYLHCTDNDLENILLSLSNTFESFAGTDPTLLLSATTFASIPRMKNGEADSFLEFLCHHIAALQHEPSSSKFFLKAQYILSKPLPEFERSVCYAQAHQLKRTLQRHLLQQPALFQFASQEKFASINSTPQNAEVFIQAISENPSLSPVLRIQAFTLQSETAFYNGNMRQVCNYFDQACALASDPSLQQITALAVQAICQMGEYRRARIILSQRESIFDPILFKTLEGFLYSASGFFAEAQETLRGLHQNPPENPLAIYLLTMARHRTTVSQNSNDAPLAFELLKAATSNLIMDRQQKFHLNVLALSVLVQYLPRQLQSHKTTNLIGELLTQVPHVGIHLAFGFWVYYLHFSILTLNAVAAQTAHENAQTLLPQIDALGFKNHFFSLLCAVATVQGDSKHRNFYKGKASECRKKFFKEHAASDHTPDFTFSLNTIPPQFLHKEFYSKARH